MKKNDQKVMELYIRNQVKDKLDYKIDLEYTFYEKNLKRDKMNVASYFDKVFEDALQTAGTIKNDNWKGIGDVILHWKLDRENPRIEIKITKSNVK